MNKVILQQKSIMLVDDELEISEKMAEAFEMEDYQVFTANSVACAKELLKKNNFIQFIISDIRMPHEDGISLLKFTMEHYPQIKMAMLSGFSEITHKEILNLGAVASLTKPADIEQLINLVESHVK